MASIDPFSSVPRFCLSSGGEHYLDISIGIVTERATPKPHPPARPPVFPSLLHPHCEWMSYLDSSMYVTTPRGHCIHSQENHQRTRSARSASSSAASRSKSPSASRQDLDLLSRSSQLPRLPGLYRKASTTLHPAPPLSQSHSRIPPPDKSHPAVLPTSQPSPLPSYKPYTPRATLLVFPTPKPGPRPTNTTKTPHPTLSNMNPRLQTFPQQHPILQLAPQWEPKHSQHGGVRLRRRNAS